MEGSSQRARVRDQRRKESAREGGQSQPGKESARKSGVCICRRLAAAILLSLSIKLYVQSGMRAPLFHWLNYPWRTPCNCGTLESLLTLVPQSTHSTVGIWPCRWQEIRDMWPDFSGTSHYVVEAVSERAAFGQICN